MPDTVRINRIDGAEMVWVPAGAFCMGSSDDDIIAVMRKHPDWDARWFAQERPQRQVEVPGFWIYRCPVTVAQYRTYCEAAGVPMPAEPAWGWTDDHPMVNVSWDDVSRYAEWAGAALPTEAQWEKAARGDDGRWWPWGNQWEPERCVNPSNAGSTCPVGSHPEGASPYGVLDMSGNVWEWCISSPPGDYNLQPSRTPQRRPVTPSGHVLRGGSWLSAFGAYHRCSYRCFECDQQRGYHTYRRPHCGFRCVVPEK